MKETKTILTPGWHTKFKPLHHSQKAEEFWAALDREVFQMRYQRLLVNSGLDQDERLPIRNLPKKVNSAVIHDDTGAAFANLISIKPDKIFNGITIENFYLQTKGVFYRIDEVPEGYFSIFRSKGSEYFTNIAKTKVVRVSDHWGYFIKNCDWFLRMRPNESIRRMSSFAFSKKYEGKKFIGIIDLNDLSHNDHSSRPQLKKKES